MNQDQSGNVFQRVMQSLSQPMTNNLPNTGGGQEIETETHPLISLLNNAPSDIRSDLLMSLAKSGVYTLDDFDRIYGDGTYNKPLPQMNNYPHTAGVVGGGLQLNQPVYEDPTEKLLKAMTINIGQNPFGGMPGNTLGLNLNPNNPSHPGVNSQDPWFDPGQAFATTQSSVLQGTQGGYNLFKDLQKGSLSTGYRHGSLVTPGGYALSPEEQLKTRNEIQAGQDHVNRGFNIDYGHIFEKARESNALEGFVGESMNPVNWLGFTGSVPGQLAARILLRSLIAGGENAALECIRLRGEAEDPSKRLTEEQVLHDLLLAAGLGGALGGVSDGLSAYVKSLQKGHGYRTRFDTQTDIAVLNREFDSYDEAMNTLINRHVDPTSRVKADVFKIVEKDGKFVLELKEPEEFLNAPTFQGLREDIARHKSTHEINTPERKKLRRRIAKDLYGRGAKEKDRQVYLLTGPPAAGKSTVANTIIKNKGALLIDSDEAKALIPEFGNGTYAGVVHLESREIIEEVIDRAINNGDNIVHPIIGWDLEGTLEVVDMFAHAGYDVHLRLISVSKVTSAKRLVKRWAETGRFVDPKYTYETVGNKPLEVYEKIKKDTSIESYKAYDNEGRKPRLIDEGENY